MMMNIQKQLQKIKETFSSPLQIKSEDIPKIELYMDQLVTYMDDNLSLKKGSETNPFVTKTMVNNYTKTKLLPSGNKKKYKADHVRRLSIIVQLKKLLSMDNIGKITNQMEEDTTQLYDVFLQAQQESFHQIPIVLDHAYEKCNDMELTEEKIMGAIALQLVAEAQSRVLVAEHILDMIADKNKESRKKNQ